MNSRNCGAVSSLLPRTRCSPRAMRLTHTAIGDYIAGISGTHYIYRDYLLDYLSHGSFERVSEGEYGPGFGFPVSIL